ncbi:MAG TPA: hypothetical protein VMS17_26610, partial [Gemmataceae bacterium]|nr:hypothetical protein [Gemmataceae bacterium]
MATNSTNPPTPPGPSLLDQLAANRERLGMGLLAVGAALAAIPISFVVRQGWSAMELIIWGAVLSIVSFAAGAFCLTAKPRAELTQTDQVRLVLLVLGGLAGFATTLLGLVLPVSRYSAVFSGGLQEWSKNPWTVWGCGAAVFGGLALMFISLLLARSVERSNALMRRLMYGYNAFFSSFLLLAVLLLINVLGYSPLPVFGALQKTYDWTANQVYTLQQATKNQLRDLNQPVHVMLLMSDNSDLRPDMITLLDNCREIAPSDKNGKPLFTW